MELAVEQVGLLGASGSTTWSDAREASDCTERGCIEVSSSTIATRNCAMLSLENTAGENGCPSQIASTKRTVYNAQSSVQPCWKPQSSSAVYEYNGQFSIAQPSAGSFNP